MRHMWGVCGCRAGVYVVCHMSGVGGCRAVRGPQPGSVGVCDNVVYVSECGVLESLRDFCPLLWFTGFFAPLIGRQ